MGIRDLFAADALEPVRPAPALPQGSNRQAGPRGRARASRVHRRAPPDERRSYGRRHRRPEDRAARCGDFRRGRIGSSKTVQADSRYHGSARTPRRARDGRLRRRRRVRHHGALGQELPQDHPPAARAAPPVRDVRRRALRRHADHRRSVRQRLRPHRAVRRRRPAHGARHPERLCARRSCRLRLPHGAAAHRRREARVDRQPADPPSDRRDRRRPYRDRYRDRVARLLRGAGREVPRALRGARAQARMDCRGARNRRGVHRPCASFARRKPRRTPPAA